MPGGGDGSNLPPLVATDFATLLTCPSFICLQNAINRTETGQSIPDSSVWAGTFGNGVSTPFTCSGWTNTADLGGGGVGLSGVLDTRWANNGTSLCDQAHRLYCFQQAT